MGFNKRLKERRENMGMTRQDLAQKIGVTSSAIANYENDVSFPKTELLFALFDALECDANYLYQDVLHAEGNFSANIAEWDVIHKLRRLDDHGRELVAMVLEKELERVEPQSYAAVARSAEEESKEFTPHREFDPAKIENGADF